MAEPSVKHKDADLTEALFLALRGLARLSRFELGENETRQPWKGALERADAAIADFIAADTPRHL